MSPDESASRREPIGDMPFQKLPPRTLQTLFFRITGRNAVIEPGEKFKLGEEMVGRGAGIERQAEVLIEHLILEDDLAGRPVDRIRALEQGHLGWGSPASKSCIYSARRSSTVAGAFANSVARR